MVVAQDGDYNLREQLRLGIPASRVFELLCDPRYSSGQLELLKDRRRCQRLRWSVTWCRDQGGHKPIDDRAGQLRMALEQIGSVGSAGGDLSVFETIPGSLLTRVMYELLARLEL